MEIQSKHRVIMIIVILALLIIFVPMLFSKRAREKLSSIVIPANPATPAVVSDATTPAVVVPPSVTTPSDSTPQMTITPVTKDQNNTAEQPATTPATLPAASPGT